LVWKSSQIFKSVVHGSVAPVGLKYTIYSMNGDLELEHTHFAVPLGDQEVGALGKRLKQ
jgi:hypothetical protein